MKIKRLFFVLFTMAAVLGCKTEPLTPANLERLQKMQDFAGISKYQFELVNQIRLNLVEDDRNDRTDRPIKGAIFKDVSIRNQIIFPNGSLGQALDLKSEGDKYVLRVYFEKNERKYPAETHYLTFHAIKSEPADYFYLVYDAPEPDSEEKGTLKYGTSDTEQKTKIYSLIFDEKPYLLMRLKRKNNEDGRRRIVPGRRIK